MNARIKTKVILNFKRVSGERILLMLVEVVGYSTADYFTARLSQITPFSTLNFFMRIKRIPSLPESVRKLFLVVRMMIECMSVFF